MRTIEVRYTGPSPARGVPGVGIMRRDQWVPAPEEKARALAAMDCGWFEVRDEAEKKPKATKGVAK